MRPSDGIPTRVGGVVLHNIGGIVSGRKTVTAAGTAEPLVAASTPCEKVDIQAELDNTGEIVVGGSGVIAAAGTRKGIALRAGDSYTLEIDDVTDIYIDATVNGEGVTFNYFT